MGLARQHPSTRLPASSFDDFVAHRPDSETWELIEGCFVMQAQPTFTHQVIAGNIERLLNDALATARHELIAVQAPAIDLSQVSVLGNATFVPDVGVLDGSDVDEGLAKSGTCHLAIEVVSPRDRKPVSDESRRQKLDIKVESYRHLPSCEAILLVEQDEPRVVMHVRDEQDWSTVERRALDDLIALPRFGFRHTLAEIYARTSVLRATASPRPAR